MGKVGQSRFGPDVNKAIDQLSQEIYSGIRLPGGRLVESELMRSFKLTRSKVRQVLVELEIFGLVEIVHNRGATVAEVTIKRIRDMYQVVAVLEGAATRFSAGRIEEEDLQQLRAVVEQQKQIKEGDSKKWRTLNHRFHRVIILKCDNEELIDMIRVHSQFTNYWFSAFAVPPMQQNIKDHLRIIEALADEDSDTAGRHMEEHVIRGGEYVLDYLQNNLPFFLKRMV